MREPIDYSDKINDLRLDYIKTANADIESRINGTTGSLSVIVASITFLVLGAIQLFFDGIGHFGLSPGLEDGDIVGYLALLGENSRITRFSWLMLMGFNTSVFCALLFSIFAVVKIAAAMAAASDARRGNSRKGYFFYAEPLSTFDAQVEKRLVEARTQLPAHLQTAEALPGTLHELRMEITIGTYDQLYRARLDFLLRVRKEIRGAVRCTVYGFGALLTGVSSIMLNGYFGFEHPSLSSVIWYSLFAVVPILVATTMVGERG
ncbi:hypothetical protein KAJ83_14305 [Marivibrio halodurans]|uniref:Uncharacterized protein n=1 Tax=Marivibrio halodurans TaxID=2039722 RepID=A0A8J7SK38_9PROT|nr:hypothetical protein [Marivibrio halodurans]MBP5858188.1 hypothetical protein [Marivibrio halodurans]